MDSRNFTRKRDSKTFNHENMIVGRGNFEILKRRAAASVTNHKIPEHARKREKMNKTEMDRLERAYLFRGQCQEKLASMRGQSTDDI